MLEATASSPGATTAQDCYETTLGIINRAIAWLETETAGKPAFGGRGTPRCPPTRAAPSPPR